MEENDWQLFMVAIFFYGKSFFFRLVFLFMVKPYNYNC